MQVESRRAARLLLLDAQGRVLLFQHEEPGGGLFWATPGGGLEPGESVEQAALREAMEELGTEVLGLERLWILDNEFRWGDRVIRQEETFFLTTVSELQFGPEVLERHNIELIRKFRWWSAEEIALSTERIYPHDLAKRLEDLGT